MGELKAVFFDLNGTLWDNSGCARHAMEIVLPNFSPPLPAGQTEEIIRRFNAALFDLTRPEHIREQRQPSWVKRFEALLDSYDARDPSVAHELATSYDMARRLVMPEFLYPDALYVLEELGRRGLKRGLIVNGAPAVQRHLIQNLRLERHLDHVVLAEVEGYIKPDPRLFRRALELAGASPEQTLYVGDSPITDVYGAVRAGVRAAWFNTGHRTLPKGFPPPDFSIASLREVLEIAES